MPEDPLRRSGLLRAPSIPGIPGTGNSSISDPFLPTEQEIQQKQQELQSEDNTNILFKLLQIPERLLGGQSVKAFIKGTAEGGIGEGLAGAFRNNPLFQILDAIPGVDIVEDVTFEDVRGAIGEDFLKVDNAAAQFGIDLLGEVLTDPLGLMWTPFAKLPGFAGKVSADLGKAVEDGAKTLLAFKVPFADAHFTLPVFKSFDVYTARTLQEMANFFNTNPVTQRVLRLFSGTQLGIGDAEARATGKSALEARQLAERTNDAIFMPMLNRVWLNLPDSAKKDPEVLQLFLQMVETGVQGTDSLSKVAAKIQAGRPFHLAQRARDALIESFTDKDLGTDILEALGKVGDDGAGIGDLAKVWQEAYPTATLPEEILNLSDDILEREGVVLRPGIDARDLKQGAPNFIDPGIKEAVPTTVRSREIVQRSDIAEDTTGVLEDVLAKVRDEDLPDTLSRILSETDGTERLKALQQSSEDFLRLAEEVGEADKAAGILRTSIETYFPRDLTPEVRDAIFKHLGGTDFTQGRKLEELTIIEANALLLEHGAKVSGFRSVNELLSEPDAVHKLWAQIFPDSFLEKLKALDPSGRKAAEFFQTNPLRAWYGRIKKSSELKGLRAYTETALEEGSPLVSRRENLQWFAENPDEVQQMISEGYVFVVKSQDADLGIELVDGHTLLGQAFDLDAKAKGATAEVFISRWVDRELEAGKSFQDTAKSLRELRDTVLRNKDLLKPGGKQRGLLKAKLKDTVAEQQRSLGRFTARIKSLDEDLNRLKNTPFADHPLVKTLRNQRDLLKRWDDAAVDILSPSEREFLQTGKVDPARSKLLEERVALRAERAAARDQVAKRLAELRKRLKTIEKDPTQFVQRGLMRQEIQKSAERLKRLRAGIKGQDELISRAKKALKGDVSSLRQTKKELEEFGVLARNEQLADLQRTEGILRDSVQAEIDRTLAQWESVKKAVGELGAEARGNVRGLVRGQVQEETTKNLNDYMRLYRKQKTEGVLALDELQQKFPELYDSMLKKNGGTEVLAMDAQVFTEMFSPDTGVLARMSKPDTLRSSLAAFDAMTAVWKGWTVLPLPFVKTRTRDFMSNILMQLQGGTKPSQLGNGSRHVLPFLRALGKTIKGTDFDALKALKMDERILAATGAKDAEEVMQFMYAHGVINNGLVRDAGFDAAQDVAIAAANEAGTEARTVGQAVVDGFSKVAGSKSAVIQSGADFAEYGDNVVKASAFFGRITSGEDAKVAAQAVRNWAYDPRLVDLSHFEKTVLRRVIPFYSWTKRAIEIQTRAYFTKPGTVAFWEKAGRAAQSLSGLTPAEYELVMPEFIKDNFGLPTHVQNDGTVKVKLFGGFVPLFEAGRIADALADTFDSDAKGGLGQQVLLNMNPLLKVPIENAINESFYTQRKLEDFPGETESFMGIEMDPKLRHTLQAIRFLKEIDDLNILDLSQLQAIFKVEGTDLSRVVNFSDAGAVPEPFHAPTTAAERIFAGGFGIAPGSTKFVSAFQQSRRKEAALKQEKNRVKGQLNRILRLREAGGRVTDDEVNALKDLLAEKTAKLRIIQGVEQRLIGRQKQP